MDQRLFCDASTDGAEHWRRLYEIRAGTHNMENVIHETCLFMPSDAVAGSELHMQNNTIFAVVIRVFEDGFSLAVWWLGVLDQQFQGNVPAKVPPACLGNVVRALRAQPIVP
jgi:hypothetical protein